jgi:hypothetical protein
MPLIPPNQSEANSSSQSASDAKVFAANDAFIQQIIAFIDNASAQGVFGVAPKIPTNADYNTIYTYFATLGYTVTLTLPPVSGSQPYPSPAFFNHWNLSAPPPSYPSAGWDEWQVYVQRYHPRMQISWGPGIYDRYFLLLETGEMFLLEDGLGDILLE